MVPIDSGFHKKRVVLVGSRVWYLEGPGIQGHLAVNNVFNLEVLEFSVFRNSGGLWTLSQSGRDLLP